MIATITDVRHPEEWKQVFAIVTHNHARAISTSGSPTKDGKLKVVFDNFEDITCVDIELSDLGVTVDWVE